MVIRSKLPNVGTTIFTVMTQMANEYNAINLSQGFPDFQCSEKLISLVEKYMRKGYNQYAPMQGVMSLREIISRKTEDLYGYKFDPENEITITAGGTQAIYTAITTFIKEDDEVIVFEPAYDSYIPSILVNGGHPIYVPLKYPDYQIDWDEVKKMINARTRMIILNTPQNPTGTIFSNNDMEMLTKLVSSTKIMIMSDEVYEHIVFDGNIHQSISRYPKLVERSIIISSFGKTFHTTGWKMGYCLAPESIMKEFRKIHQYLVFSVNTPVQYAVAEFLEDKNEYLSLSSFYQEKRDYFLDLLKGSKYKFTASKGTYFQTLDYSSISDERDKDFAVRLTKENGVASTPVSVFYHDNLNLKILRFCFAKSKETLEKAVEKLLKVGK